MWPVVPAAGLDVRVRPMVLVAHSGDMMALPCGGEGGASSLSLLACLAGAVVLWRRGRSTAVASC